MPGVYYINIPDGKSEEGVIEPSGDSVEESDGEATGEPSGAVEGDIGPLPAKSIP